MTEIEQLKERIVLLSAAAQEAVEEVDKRWPAYSDGPAVKKLRSLLSPPAEKPDNWRASVQKACDEMGRASREGRIGADGVIAPAEKKGDATTFQARVRPWLLECFGQEIADDLTERNHRFLEESLELVQSTGCTQSEAHQLVDYVFVRPMGEQSQEAGGVMVTLAALCLAANLDMHICGEVELARIWTKVEKIRAKQAAKPKHSPLPAPASPPTERTDGEAYVAITPGEKLRRGDEFRWDGEWRKVDVNDLYFKYATRGITYRRAAIQAASASEGSAE